MLDYHYQDNKIALVQIVIPPYESWSGGAPFDDDTNSDEVPNGIAWVLGAANPSASATGLLPTLDDTSDPDFLIFNYRRKDTAAADENTAIKVQYGGDPSGWIDATAGPDIVITPFNDFHGEGIDNVEVKIRRTLATGGRLFARLHAVTAP